MKNLIKTLLVGITAAILLTGCGMGDKGMVLKAPTAKKVDNDLINIHMQINKFANEFDINDRSVYEQYHAAFSKGLQMSFHKAAQATLDAGHTHFVLIIRGSNAYRGYPLNTLKDIAAHNLDGWKHDFKVHVRGGNFIDNKKGHFNLKIMPLSNPHYTIAAFDAAKVLKENIIQ